jgi:nucleoside-diphosphate-sugar epimerase
MTAMRCSLRYEVLAPSREELDIVRREHWERIAGDFDSIVHAAAYVPAAGGAFSDVPMIAELSIVGTQNALEFANGRGVRRFVYCSSANIYAPPAAGT